MVLKLIEAGGFIGRSKSAELDVNALSPDEQKVIRDFFSEKENKSTFSSGKSRDQFQYSIEFEGKSITLPEVPSENKMLSDIFEKLVDKLQY
jgi:hypothetical protein